MDKLLLVYLLLAGFINCFSQDLPAPVEQQVENIADAGEEETGDDSFLRELEHLRKDPLDINSADADELKQLFFLSALQVECLLTYRSLLGRLNSLYELQAVPAWDIGTIRKVIPYIRVGPAISLSKDIRNRFRSGQHSFLFRVSRPIENLETGSYLGGPEHLPLPISLYIQEPASVWTDCRQGCGRTIF